MATLLRPAISPALLRFFAPDGVIATVDLPSGDYREDPPGPSETTAGGLWQRTEEVVAATMDAVAGESVFEDASLLINLTAITAVHHAHGHHTRRAAAESASPTEDPAKAFRRRAAESYAELIQYLSRCDARILVAPADRDFIIGDTPVAAVGHPPAGVRDRHYAPPLPQAEAVYFPVHPRFCVQFPAREPGYTDIRAREVDRINLMQITHADHEVHFRPDPRTRRLVEEKARTWTPRS
ncbi:DUF4238 domain-containing protein [Actinoplanes derwentensis]|uniref:Uncharacterized protein n=1 Tax=Actinoplanes derwentensis TaxID=113562 RepID=A0A1H1TQF8_9ACTN|nr:DUF4238 domain-containing protein [Actinoplanes derwentensis]GID85098.1 hypothetical protein Ade03nite_40220 [Actinoplanes derwentensis]SDS62166.1 Protein of unknown function [Actinoplanes derwentensis]